MGGLRRFSGSRLQQLREDRHLLQHDLAERLRKRGFGTTQTTVSRWENGQEPRASVMGALADELDVKVDELYGDADDAEAAPMAPLAAELHYAAQLAAAVHGLVDARMDARASRVSERATESQPA